MECKIAIVLTVLLLLTACSKDPHIDDLRKQDVSYITIEINDKHRERMLSTKLWFPASKGGASHSHNYDDGFKGYIAEGQGIASPYKKHPLVLLSHGTGGSNGSLSWLAEVLASNGYIVAAPNHWNNTTRNNTDSGIVRLWDRPKDLSFVLSHLLEDQYWGELISPDQIFAAGHSAGGFSVLGLAGAEYSVQKMDSYCESTPANADCVIAEDIDWSSVDRSDHDLPYRDSRFKAVIALAPGIGRGVSESSLNSINIPVHIFAALDDQWLPFEGNAQYYNESIPNSKITVFETGGHYLFLQECSTMAKLIVQVIIDEDVCGLDSSLNRQELQNKVSAVALSLFSGT